MTVTVKRNQLFTSVDYPTPLYLDVYLPSTPTKNRPLVVNAHGGGWHLGDKAWQGGSSQTLAAAGIVVIAPNYRLAYPDSIWPNQKDDITQALSWAAANATRMNVDLNRVGVMGTSAGGTMVGRLAEEQTSPFPIKAVVTWSCMGDFPTAFGYTSDPGWPEFSAGFDALFGIGSGGPGVGPWDAGRADDASVALHPDAAPPWLVCNCDHEFIPLEQADILEANLVVAGRTATQDIFPGDKHGTELLSVGAGPPTVDWFNTYLV